MPNDPAIVEQYRRATTEAVLCVRTERGLLEVTGNDRTTWLNNLVTNVIKTLQPGEGNYAFAVNLKGRVVFDMNLLVLPDRVWLDIDTRFLEAAKTHLDRYIIAEDVTLRDISGEVGRAAILGPKTADIIAQAGLGNLTPMAQLQHVEAMFRNTTVRMLRHDFAGLPTVELLAPKTGRDNPETALAETMVGGAISGRYMIANEGIDILRIESGIPKSMDDIDEDIVPPETGQIERGISYHKGCYLGQEVIERMRSHGVLARKLVGLRIEGETPVAKNTPVKFGEKDVGRVTSCCWSEAVGSLLALGYVKTAQSTPGTALTIAIPDAPRRAEIVPLPVRR